MTILVTGTNGFIGGHVASYFKNRGDVVVGLGRSATPYDSYVVDQYIQCDLSTDAVSVIPSEVATKIDAVIHLAADMRKEPHTVEVVCANCGGTQRLLEMCKANGIPTFLQLSSLPVIGHPVEHPITESHPLSPYTVYHVTKVTEELLAEYARKYYGIRSASFRISAPVGPRMNPNTIFPTFVRRALKNEDIVLLGKGTRQQNYLHVSDICRCLELALSKDTVRGIYNLTSNIIVSNSDLAKAVIETLSSSSKVKYTGDDPADNYIWDASLQKLQHDSGYEPQADLYSMITEYAQWINNKYDNKL